MIMDIKERIGEYEVIKHGEIIVFNDKRITLEARTSASDETPLYVTISFIGNINKKIKV